jgi:hypothetical protein
MDGCVDGHLVRSTARMDRWMTSNGAVLVRERTINVSFRTLNSRSQSPYVAVPSGCRQVSYKATLDCCTMSFVSDQGGAEC